MYKTILFPIESHIHENSTQASEDTEASTGTILFLPSNLVLACFLLLWYTHDQKQLVEERGYFLLCPSNSSSVKNHHSSSWRQELQWSLQRNVIYYLVPTGLLSYLSYTTKDHLPRVRTVSSGLGLPTSCNQKNNAPNRFSCRWIGEGIF